MFARRVPGAAPPRVADRLAGAEGPLPVLHRGRHALYLGVGDGCVGVVSRGAARVPCALRLAAVDLGPLADARSVRVVAGVLHLDDVALPVGRLVDVRVPGLPAGAAPPAGDLAAAARRASGLPGAALDLLAAGDPAAVPLLLGRGDGLTPLGDDVLCGWLAARVAVGEPVGVVAAVVAEQRRATTTLSAELLDCAARGEVLPEYAVWVRALDRQAPDGDRLAARTALLAVGHTSGAGLLLGGALALGARVGSGTAGDLGADERWSA